MKLKDIIKSVDEAAQTLVGFLKARYLSRDGLEPQSYISYERSTVTEDVIIECIREIESDISSSEKSIKATLEEGLENG